MRTLYIDCTNGICGDMVLSALLALGMDVDCEARHELEHRLNLSHEHDHDHEHEHSHGHNDGHECECDCDCEHDHGHLHIHTHRSYREICKFIDEAPISPEAKKIAHDIYRVIAEAEASVHETTIEEVHFHEVGRAEAIMNIISIAVCLKATEAEQILCSKIHDGCGFIECSHGKIPVPVPAVMAIRTSEAAKNQGHIYVSENIETEMVTPSGLGILVGIGTRHAPYPEGSVISRGIGYGTRDTGRGGLEITLLEV